MLVIENFFEDPDSVRDLALSQVFYSKEDHPGDIAQFPGMRTDYLNIIAPDLYQALLNAQVNCVSKLTDISKFTEYWTKFSFSYTLKDTKINLHRDFDKGWNGFNTFFGGVIYLTPNPPIKSGTIVEDKIVDNIYNTYVMYDATCLHGLENSFGTNKKDARLVLTHFIYLK